MTSISQKDNAHNVNSANGTRWRGLLTLNFKPSHMPHKTQSARQTILEFLHDYSELVQSELFALWSLVETTPQNYHVHIVVSELPKLYATGNQFERGYVVDLKSIQALLSDYGCYLTDRKNPHNDKHQKKIIHLENIVHSRNAETYILTQPRLDSHGHKQAVILHEYFRIVENNKDMNSLENTSQLQLELDAFSTHDNSDNIPQKTCSSCNTVYPHTIDNFHWHKKDALLRSQCRTCYKLFHVKRRANRHAEKYEIEHGLLLDSLGTLSNADVLQLYQSQCDKNGVLRCFHVGDVLNVSDMSVDHIDAFLSGGQNVLDNICLTTRSRNSSKGSKSIGKWIPSLAKKYHVLHKDAPSWMRVQKRLFD